MADQVGGSGGESVQTTTRDVRLLSRALAESWDIPADTRLAIVERLGDVVKDPQAKLRAVLAASKTLATFSRINLTVVDAAIRARAHEELEARVADLEARLVNDRGGRR